MNDNQSQTESLLDIVTGIHNRTIMLPEFQRDFRWELEQTYDLFDSLIRDIFIGTIIYGKPSFEITLREIDQRQRKGKGSRSRLKTYEFSASEIHAKTQTENFRIILDGQQRITSIYRAIVGIDSVHVILRDGLDPATINELSLEQMMESVAGEEKSSAISVKLADAYEADKQGLDDEDLNHGFAQSLYMRRELKNAGDIERKRAEKIYRRAIRKLIDLFKQQKLIAYYMLDMALDKFCAFFERSNSRGIQLNFTDILAAKLYGGFNLRRKIEEFESQSRFALNREAVVRAIAYVCVTQNGTDAISIDKSYILEHLQASDFQAHWDEVCALYTDTLNYLTSQHYILSQDWMPSDNMVIPMMMFLREIGGFNRINEDQRSFLEFWYWASIFSNRYSGASNEVIISDSAALIQVARSERIRDRGYFTRLRSRVTEADDLYSYSKKASAIYRGILNLLAYASKGLLDWNSTQKIDISMKLEDHHIYPQAYIAAGAAFDIEQEDAEQLVDCVVNRTLITKPTNISIGKKPPQTYLAELQQKNTQLASCLPGHLIPADMIGEPMWNNYFGMFLSERAQSMLTLVRRYAIDPADSIAAKYGTQADSGESAANSGGLMRLRDMLADGRVYIGDRVYVRKQPDCRATIVGPDIVEYEGEVLSINDWGERVTGWPSINIYASMFLERTGRPLGELRDTPTSSETSIAQLPTRRQPNRPQLKATEPSSKVTAAPPSAPLEAAKAHLHPAELEASTKIGACSPEGWELVRNRFENNQALEQLFEAIRQQIHQVCPDATCYARQEWICFKRVRNFLVLDVQKDSFDIGIAVGEAYVHPEILKRPSRGGTAGWNGWASEYQSLRVRSVGDLDEEFRRLVRVAYESYGERQRR